MIIIVNGLGMINQDYDSDPKPLLYWTYDNDPLAKLLEPLLVINQALLRSCSAGVCDLSRSTPATLGNTMWMH